MPNLLSLSGRPSQSLRGTSPFSSLQNEINNLFEDFFGAYEPGTAAKAGRYSPIAVDVIETDKSYKIEAELPGMKAEDVYVSCGENSCTIRGEKQEYEEDRGSNYLKRERSYGVAQRTIPLPEGADLDNAEASFKKGVLWIKIPKKAEAAEKTRKLKVKEAA